MTPKIIMYATADDGEGKIMKDPQKITVTFVFKVEHAPNLESHLHFVLKKYLQEKGIVLNDDNTVDV